MSEQDRRQGEEDARWKRTTRRLAVVGFAVCCVAVLLEISVPWGFFVLLVGMFFGPDVYEQFGPGG